MDEVDEGASEGLRPKLLRSPLTPTQDEIDEHEALGHTTHRTWCGHCIRARGLLEQHRKQEKDLSAIPTLSMDYFYFAEGEQGLTHLQIKDSHSGMSWASPVPAKSDDQFAINFVLGVLEEVGYQRLILRSDNEPAIKTLKVAVKKAASCDVVLEEAKTGDSRSNGVAEVAVNETKKQVRAMKSSLQERMKKEIDEKHPIWSWVARHGNFLMSRYRLGPDGRTAYERLKGKRWKRPMVTFGEKVHFRPLKSYTKNQSDMAEQLKLGYYVGTHGRNGDVLIMTSEGVWKGGSVKRVTAEQRWDPAGLDEVVGVPWNLRPRRVEDIDAVPVRIDLPPAEGRLTPEAVEKEPGPARNLYVKRKDVEGHYTLGCPGCIAIQTGLPARSHSAECRTSVQQRLMESEEGRFRVEKAKKRKSEVQEGTDEALPALEDVPDMEEEVHAQDAIGNPGRVDPVDQPAQANPGRVSPLGRPVQDKRMAIGDAKAESSKKARVESKSEGLYEKDKRTFADLYKDIAAEEKSKKAAKTSSSASSSSSKPMNQVISDLSSILQERMMQNAPGEDILEIGQLIMNVSGNKVDVAEIYNPRRFTSQANRFGLTPGFAIDLEVLKNEKGEYWDLSRKEDKLELKRLLKEERPFFLLGSPPCGPFSPLQNLSKNKRTEEENEAIRKGGVEHLEISVECYYHQMENGRFFLHEHPLPAASWKEPCMRKLLEDGRTYVVRSPMCRWNMTAEDQQGIGFVRKETQYVTNSKVMAEALTAKCTGDHRHVHLVNGRARKAQVYPAKLVRAILKAIKRELHNCGELSHFGEAIGIGPVPASVSNEPQEEMVVEENIPEKGMYFDTVTGTPLETSKVLAARAEEMAWIEKQGIYVVVDEQECWDETGKPPITLKWVDKNKGDDSRPNYRSRLVVREVKKKGQELAEHEHFSAMPPLEALKALCSLMTSLKKSKKGEWLKLRLLDISRAHFYGESRRPVFTNLPEGSEQPGKCARLVRTMYGTQDASSVWQSTYTKLVEENGYVAGKGWPAIFYNEKMDVRFLVHGDDFLILADEQGHQHIEKVLSQKFEYREDGKIGPEESDGTTMTVLNRIIEFNKSNGVLTYEADPRHAEQIVKQLGLEDAKEVITPNEKPKPSDVEEAERSKPLNESMAKMYRSVVMRAAYLSLDRADLAETVKCLARSMQTPTEFDLQKLKRMGRYIKGSMRIVQHFRPQRMYAQLRGLCDSDHAGCLRTRKSTSGLILMAGQHCLKTSSTLQTTIALSSGESEYYSIVKCAAMVIGAQAMFKEWGIDLSCKILTDSSAAKGMSSRRGLGRTRHVHTRYLWVQERIAENQIQLEKISTHDNMSDLGTKALSKELKDKFMSRIGQHVCEGKSKAAKAVQG